LARDADLITGVKRVVQARSFALYHGDIKVTICLLAGIDYYFLLPVLYLHLEREGAHTNIHPLTGLLPIAVILIVCFVVFCHLCFTLSAW